MRVASSQTGRRLLAGIWIAVFLFGCATPQIDWDSRIGHYTYDQAAIEMGPPDRLAQLEDGSKVAEWLESRGYSHGYVTSYRGFYLQQYEQMPSRDRFIRLVFDRNGQLARWQRVVK